MSTRPKLSQDDRRPKSAVGKAGAQWPKLSQPNWPLGPIAADLSDGLAAAMASIGTGIGLAIWFGWPIVMQGAAVLLSLLPALDYGQS